MRVRGERTLDISSDAKYHLSVKKRMGRPPTGQQPRLSIRMDREALRLANERAKAAGKTVGRWLEEAILEKTEKEKRANDVTQTDR